MSATTSLSKEEILNRRRNRRGIAVGLTLALGAAIVSAAPASAEGSNWWYDYYSVADAHAAGWTGKGITIAVLDDGINTDVPELKGADLTVDPNPLCAQTDGKPNTVTGTEMASKWHGTNVTNFIVGNGTGAGKVQGIAPDAKILFYGDGRVKKGKCDAGKAKEFSTQVYQAIDAGAQIITTSMAWTSPGQDGANAIAYAQAKGVLFLAGQPNSQMSIYSFPGHLNGVVQVSAINPKGEIEWDEDLKGEKAIHDDTTVVGPGEELLSVGNDKNGNWAESVETQGTSFATPITAGLMADVWQKYPKATANQLIQSLIHNTTLQDHELLRDTESGYGYGPISLTHLLRVDPTQYPDENPLMDKPFGKPTAKTVAGIKAKLDAGEEAKPKHVSSFDGYADTGTTTPSPLGEFFGFPFWLLVGAVVLAFLIGGSVLTIVLVSRRRKRAADRVR
ncbi:S8 family peptidase [Leifsonia aquatica]|uniref:S8 family peptidase n=1 Tax=Leifsonia aquatica TaxID=144185 RepID=UPI00384E2EBF